MEKEYQILSSINKNANITQRELSEKTGVSLGNVNILLKRMAKKGLLKAERINSRTISYILTPHGIKELTKRTYDFVVDSYKNILKTGEQIKNIALSLKEQGVSELILFGPRDEFHEIVVNSFREIHQVHAFFSELNAAQLSALKDRQRSSSGHDGDDDGRTYGKFVILTWNLEESDMLEKEGIRFINLVDMLGR